MIPTQSIIVPTRMALLGIFIGAVSGLALAQMSPGPTLAAVVTKPPFQIGKALDTDLLKLDGDYYGIGHTPDVSMEPQSSTTVRKIGYGRTSFVTIDRTSSGTYSSDGLASPNVRYPGIYSEKLALLAPRFAAGVLGWSKLTGWVKIPLLDAGSIGFLDDTSVPASQDGVCVKDTETGGCR